MSVDYAAGLSEYDDLGICGLDEVFDTWQVVKEKVKVLAGWMREYNGSCIIHVGAGLSTSAGIPDFRGKRGVWTKLLSNKRVKLDKNQSCARTKLEVRPIKKEGEEGDEDEKNEVLKPFDETTPTVSHLALKRLCQLGFVKHIVSQNVDGLFLKSNLPKAFISELHGNFYLDECTKCRSRFIRNTASRSMRLRRSSVKCPRELAPPCKGYLRDTILDWESPIPYNELRLAERESKRNKLHICIGTSLQLRPSKDLVCNPAKSKSTKLVVINLQPIALNERANLVINYYADDVMRELANQLNFEIPPYNAAEDPTKNSNLAGKIWKRV